MKQATITDFNHPHKRVWAIAGPAILANISLPLVGMVDTWAIGHMPDPVYLASVGLGAAVFSYVFWTLGFLRMGTTGLIAQAHGAMDADLIRREFVRGAAIALSLALLIMVFQGPLKKGMFLLLETPESVWPLAEGYFDIRIWASPATLLFLVVNGFLIGTARAKEALWLQLLLNITNGTLNVLFVVGLGMGVNGVALGTVIAEWAALFIGLLIIHKHLGVGSLFATSFLRITWQYSRLKRMASINSHIFLRTLILLGAFMMMTKVSARLGEEALAVTHVLSQYMLLMSLGLDGVAYAAEALAGAAYGAKSREALRKWVNLTLFWSLMCAVFSMLFFFVLGGFITDILTDVDVIRAKVKTLMPVMIFMPLASFACYQFDGVYIGMTASRAMLVTMFLAAVLYAIAHYYFVAAYGLLGIWLALIVLMMARGGSQAIWYHYRLKNI